MASQHGGQLITSRSNPHLARLRALRRRADRDATGLCIAEGIRVVTEAAESGAELVEVVYSPALLRSESALALIDRLSWGGVPCLTVSAEAFASISVREGPQGIAAVVRQRWLPITDTPADAGLCWVVLEGVHDAGNLGSILRTCDAVGAAGVILVGDTTDPYDPISVRASTGAVWSQRLARTDIAGLAAWKRQRGVWLTGTSGAATTDFRSASYGRPLAVASGSEQAGLSSGLLALCDETVRIPMVGRCDSLNLAVATSVVLYEVMGRAG